MDIQDLAGLEKPLTKLIETIGEGLGEVGNSIFKFDSRKIKRIGNAKAESDKQRIVKKAEGQAYALEVLDRAGKRFALEQYSKQMNLENIIVKSQELLRGQTVNNEPVDKDWTARFLSVAQDVSREEMQELLARILANEVTRPSTYSLRTLNLVRDLSKSELESFQKFVALSIITVGMVTVGAINRDEFRKYGLNFIDYVQLTDIGLINPQMTLNLTLPIKVGEVTVLDITGSRIIITSVENDKTLELPLIKFTSSGLQLASLLKDKSENEFKQTYIIDLCKQIESQGYAAEVK